MKSFYLYHAIRADLFSDLNQLDKAKAEYLKASSLADNELEINYLNNKAKGLA